MHDRIYHIGRSERNVLLLEPGFDCQAGVLEDPPNDPPQL